jgi:hypothetical protein
LPPREPLKTAPHHARAKAAAEADADVIKTAAQLLKSPRPL